MYKYRAHIKISDECHAVQIENWCKTYFGAQGKTWQTFDPQTGSTIDCAWLFKDYKDYTIFLLKWQ